MKMDQGCLKQNESFKEYFFGLMITILILSIAAPLLALLALRVFEVYEEEPFLKAQEAQIMAYQARAGER